MEVAVACFVKTLGLSPVKTRLAAGIGRERADQVYKICVEFMREAMTTAESTQGLTLRPYWAVAEEEGIKHIVWSDLPLIWQGEGGLGDRLKFVFEELQRRHGAVVVIGADCPMISPTLIAEAAAIVASGNEHVLGPTDDGGYYLFGSRFVVDHSACDKSESVWLKVPYSEENTAQVFTQRLSAKRQVTRLATLFDIDTKADLDRMTASEISSPWNLRVADKLRVHNAN